MHNLTRRSFANLGFGCVAGLAWPNPTAQAQDCLAPPRQLFLPGAVLLNCASAENFRTFRRNSGLFGLAGVVSMANVSGTSGSIGAGTMILYPWLKPLGQKLRKPPSAFLPVGNSMSAMTASKPIPNAALPQDEYLCRLVLQTPWESFIGFSLDMVAGGQRHNGDWQTTLDALPDGQSIQIDWTSANLNGPWFGGSKVIPNQAVCHGREWRGLIAKGITQIATGTC